MQNKKLILSIILSVIAVFSLLYGILAPARIRRDYSRGPLGIQKEITVTEGIAILLGRQAKRSGYSNWGRNPFSLSGALIRTYGGLNLNGIMWDKETPIAIINEALVKIGDKIGGNTVIDIKQDRVILNDGTKDFELRLER